MVKRMEDAMSEMLEKAARAAEEADMTWVFDPLGERFAHIARAVLMAVREPTGEMTYAATEDEFHEAIAQDKAGKNWTAMIDAILAEELEG